MKNVKMKLENRPSFQLRVSNFTFPVMPEFKIDGEQISFWVRVKPRSTHERLTVDPSGELRLELHAPATEGQANEACMHFLARALRLPQGCVAILSGQKARRKLLRVTGRSAQECIEGIRTLAGLPAGEGRKLKFENRNSKIARTSSSDIRVSDPPREERKR